VDEYRNERDGQIEDHWRDKPEGHFICSETDAPVFAHRAEESPTRARMAFGYALPGVPERSNGQKGGQRNARPIASSEVKQMQRTILEELTPRTKQDEPEFLRLIRADARIRSLAIRRSVKLAVVKQPDDPVKDTVAEFAGLSKGLTDAFRVTDLLEDITYLVGQSGSLSLIVFSLKNELVMVGVQPGSDLTEIAHDFVKHLEVIRIST